MTRLSRDTYLQSEEYAYPNGGQTRKGRAVFPDGITRAVYAGIPDTYFSIPAHARIAGRYVAGYVTVETSSDAYTSGRSDIIPPDPGECWYVFRPTWKRCPSRYSGAVTLRGRAIRCDGRVNPDTGRCSMDDIPGTGSHGNTFAARYWSDAS